MSPKPFSLYNNSSGSTGTIPLSDSAANYSYLEIFLAKIESNGATVSGWWSVKVPSPDGKIVQVGTQYYPGSSSGVALQLIGKTISISGKSITPVVISSPNSEYYINFATGTGAVTALGTQSTIRIMRVDGYK